MKKVKRNYLNKNGYNDKMTQIFVFFFVFFFLVISFQVGIMVKDFEEASFALTYPTSPYHQLFH